MQVVESAIEKLKFVYRQIGIVKKKIFAVTEKIQVLLNLIQSMT